MIRLGLTGSIGMGKSTIANMFKAEGVPVWDADEAVHRLYKDSNLAKARLSEAFGDVLSDGRVDRTKLSAALQVAENGFERLNAIVHPMLEDDRARFFTENAAAPLVVLDIPLLFESGRKYAIDVTLVVSAPYEIQAKRVLARPGMTPEKFAAILARQMPDAEKRARADVIIDTSRSLDDCRTDVRKLIARFHAQRA